MTLSMYWDRDPDLLVCAMEWSRYPKNKSMTLAFAALNEPDDVRTVLEIGPPPGNARFALGAVPCCKLPKGSFSIILRADPTNDNNDSFLETVHLDCRREPDPRSTTRWEADWEFQLDGASDAGLTITKTTPSRKIDGDGQNFGLHDVWGGGFAGKPVATGPDAFLFPSGHLVNQGADLAEKKPMRQIYESQRGRALYPSAYPTGRQKPIEIAVRWESSGGQLHLNLVCAPLPATEIGIAILKIPLVILGDRNASSFLIEEAKEHETVLISADGTARISLNLNSFAPLDRIILRSFPVPAQAPTAAAPVPPSRSWFNARAQAGPPTKTDTSPPPAPPVEFVSQSEGGKVEFGPILALANYITTVEFDVPLSRVLRAETEHMAGAMRDRAGFVSRVMSGPSRLALRQAADGISVSAYLTDADRAVASTIDQAGSCEISSDKDIILQLLARQFGARAKWTVTAKALADWAETLLEKNVPVDQLRAVLLNGVVVWYAFNRRLGPTQGREDCFHLDVARCTTLGLEKVMMSKLARVLSVPGEPGSGAAVDAWVAWLKGLTPTTLAANLPKSVMLARIGDRRVKALMPIIFGLQGNQTGPDQDFLLRLLELDLDRGGSETDNSPAENRAERVVELLLDHLDAALCDAHNRWPNDILGARQIDVKEVVKDGFFERMEQSRIYARGAALPSNFDDSIRKLLTAKPPVFQWSDHNIPVIEALSR